MARGPMSAESLGLTGRIAELYSSGKIEQTSWFTRVRCAGCDRAVHVTYSLQFPKVRPTPELCADCIIEEVE